MIFQMNYFFSDIFNSNINMLYKYSWGEGVFRRSL